MFPPYDQVLACLLAVGGAIAVTRAFLHLSPYISHYSTWDFWFDGDSPAVADQMSSRWSPNHYRTSHHPLFSLLVSTPVLGLRLLGLSAAGAIASVLAAVSAAWIAAFFACLRLLGLPRLDAVVYTLLAAVSAAVVFWFPVPESFAFGALSMVAALTLAALWDRDIRPPVWLLVVVCVATASFTTTNLIVGVAILGVLLGVRRGTTVALVCAGVLVALWGLQRLVYPLTESPFVLSVTDASVYVFNEESLGLLAKLRAFFLHSIVLPDIDSAYGFRLSVQGAGVLSGGPLRVVAGTLWLILLAIAAWSALRLRRQNVVKVLVLCVVGQLLLHVVFGVETFLYSAHFAPLLIIACALSSITEARVFALAIAIVVAVLTAANNVEEFGAAARRLRDRYVDEYRFTMQVADTIPPDALVICGREAAAAKGEAGVPRRAVGDRPVSNIIYESDPDTCAFLFPGLDLKLNGWVLVYEDWSIDAVETLRNRGARYFITRYEDGLQRNTQFVEEMGRRYHVMEFTPDWAFYDLRGEL